MNTKFNSKNTCCFNIHNSNTTIYKRIVSLFTFIAFSVVCAYGQGTTIILNASSNGKSTVVECGTKYLFYDSGGSNGNYNNNERFSYTFESCRPIEIIFTSFTTESSSSCSNWDYILLYDGSISDANKIARGQTGCSSSSLSVGTIYTANSGTLIIKWNSDNYTNATGWAAEITCSGDPCLPHTLTYNTTANCSGSGTASVAPTGTTANSATVTSEVPTCSSLPTFLGWNTSQYGSGTSYVAGDNISLLRNDITLYAQYSNCEEKTIIEDTYTNYNVPFCSYGNGYVEPKFTYSQMLYTKDQIVSASGYNERFIIHRIFFKYTGPDVQEMRFDLFMANTNKTSLSTYVNSNLLQVVTDQTITFSPGWIEIVLDSGFVWDGTSNLVIAMYSKTTIVDDNNRRFYNTQVTNSVKYQYSTSNNEPGLQSNNTPSGTWTGGTTTNTLPNLKLCMAPYCEPPTFSFTTATAECALGSSYSLTSLFTLNNPTNRPVTYTCDPAEATIVGSTITPHVGGEITVNAHIDAYNGNCSADAQATLTVTCTDSRFEFDEYGVFCTIGNSVSAPSYTTTSTSSTVTYASDNEAIATVNPSTGAVTGVSEGYTTITATLASSGNFCQKTATFVAYVSPDETCMPFTSGNCNVHLTDHCESPFYSNNYYTFSYVQMLYPASELRASGLSAGRINKIAFHYYGRPTGDQNFSQKFRLFIAPTATTDLNSSWGTPSSEFEKKFDGEKSFTPDSWTYIELTDGFDWDGTSNILIAVNTYETSLPVTCQFCTRNSDQLARYVGKQSSEIGGATEIPLNPTTKLPSYGGDESLYRADIKFCQDASIIVLPIELVEFKAQCLGNRINISWETASEKNNDHYILERSANAVDFTEIARISGADNSIETIRYSYNDTEALDGDNYYRLIQVDSDGTRSTSEIIVAKCNTNNKGTLQVEAYPNPFSNELTVTLSNFNGQRNITIEIFDMLGKVISTKTIENPDIYHEIKFNLDGIPNSAYSLRVRTSCITINKLVVKEN